MKPHRYSFFGPLVALTLLASGFEMSNANARGALGRDQDACVLKVGPDFMYFTGYQPGNSNKKFCEDIPTTGEAIFVLDFAQEEMRAMTADFRILRDLGEAEDPANLDQITVAYLPPKSYPGGTMNFGHNFGETGNFIGIVTVDGPNGEHWTARFPFSVGGDHSGRTPYYLLSAAAVLGILLLLWGKSEKPPKPKPMGRA